MEQVMGLFVFIAVLLAILGILKEEIPALFNFMVVVIILLAGAFFMMIGAGMLRVVYELIKPFI